MATQTTRSRLTRNAMDRVLGGVCGGIASHLGVSAWWVRVAFLALTLAIPPFGLLLYLLMWIVMPPQTLSDLPTIGAEGGRVRGPRPETTLLLGAGVVIVGVVALAYNMNILNGVNGSVLTPFMLMLIGMALLLRQVRGR